MRGKVVAFDEHRGLGELESDDGSRLSFHCTAIADGSRTIPVDATVEFELAPGPLGRWEATHIVATVVSSSEERPRRRGD